MLAWCLDRKDRESPGLDWRRPIEPAELVSGCVEILGVQAEKLRSRSQAVELVQAREIIMVVGVGRFGLKVEDLAWEVRTSPDGMSKTLGRGLRRRWSDERFRERVDAANEAIAEGWDACGIVLAPWRAWHLSNGWHLSHLSADQGREQYVPSKIIVIVEVLVPERDPENTLR